MTATNRRAIPAPRCAFVFNGLTGERNPRLRKDPTGFAGPWAWPVNIEEAEGNRQIARDGASCRDIFLIDVMRWSQNLSIRNQNQGQMVFVFTFPAGQDYYDQSIPIEEVQKHVNGSIQSLQNALTKWLGEFVPVEIAPVDKRFYKDENRVHVSVTCPKQYWGNLLFSSFMAAVCRSWLHLGITDPDETVWGMWNTTNKYDWAPVQDRGRFNTPPTAAPHFTMEQFATLVKVVGKTGSPITNPDAYRHQLDWFHYFHDYFMSNPYRAALTPRYSWTQIGASPLGCTTAYHQLHRSQQYTAVSTEMVRALVYPACPTWIGDGPELNEKGTPTWLKVASKEKPVPNAAPAAQIAAETILRSTPMDTPTATPAATAARRVSR